VLGVEYLGNSRIVTLKTAQGTVLRAKVQLEAPPVRGDHLGLAFRAEAVSLFDRTSGRALRTVRHG
jgi:multiple sugar transport system ATP-binding protein